jgi:hypothetical protein
MKSLSARQIRILRSLQGEGLSVEKVQEVVQGTFWSLLYRGLLERKGDYVRLTEEGREYLSSYTQVGLIYRKHARGITQRVQDLLRVGRKR